MLMSTLSGREAFTPSDDTQGLLLAFCVYYSVNKNLCTWIYPFQFSHFDDDICVPTIYNPPFHIRNISPLSLF